MKYYAHFGHKDFILCLGYKGNVIKDYFLRYDESVSNDFVLSQGGRNIKFINRDIDDWTITFVESGVNATIAERLKSAEPYLAGEEMFLANYGDGLSDLDLHSMISEFQATDAVGSMLLVQPTSSFDLITSDAAGHVKRVSPISESEIWINGGFFAFRQEIFQYVNPGEELVRQPFARLIDRGALRAHKCAGFWQCMDTFKDKQSLEELNQGNAPWKVWRRTAADFQTPREISASA
jgi:glucose-1-phosphate cytidylyltransferase